MGIAPEDAELFRRKQYQASFGITTWYDGLKEHTFRTEHLPISFDEGKAIVTLHEEHEKVKHKNLGVFKDLPPEEVEKAKEALAKVQCPEIEHGRSRRSDHRWTKSLYNCNCAAGRNNAWLILMIG